MTLTQNEINQRLIELRNLRKLYQVAKDRINIQNQTIKELKARIKELETKDQEKDTIITDLQYQLAEVKALVFGKQKHAQQIQKDDDEDSDTPPKSPRPKESYQRPIPKDSEVTKAIHHRFPRDKNGDIRLRTYYIEEIPLSINKIV